MEILHALETQLLVFSFTTLELTIIIICTCQWAQCLFLSSIMSTIFIQPRGTVDDEVETKGGLVLLVVATWRGCWSMNWKKIEALLYQILRAVETSLLVRLLFPAKIFWYFWTSPGMQCHPSGPWQSPFALCQHLDKLADQLYRPDNWKLELIPDFLKFVPRDKPWPTTCREHCRLPIHK